MFLTALFFGTFEVVSKLIINLKPVQINFLRFFIGGIDLSPFALIEIKKKKIRFNKIDLIKFVFLGFLLVFLSTTFLQIAVQKSSASLAAFIFSSNPIFIVVFAYIFLKEKPNKYIKMAIVLGIVGLSFVTNIFNGLFNWYIRYALIAAIIFSFYIVLMRNMTEKYGSLVSFTTAVFFGTFSLFVYLIITDVSIWKDINSGNILQLIYIGTFCSGIAYLLYFRGMALTSTNIGSIVFFLKPIIATIFSVLLLKETLNKSFFIGAPLIAISSILMFYGKKPKSNS